MGDMKKIKTKKEKKSTHSSDWNSPLDRGHKHTHTHYLPVNPDSLTITKYGSRVAYVEREVPTTELPVDWLLRNLGN